MGKAKKVFFFLGITMLGFRALSVPAAQKNFSGVWVLNKANGKNPPSGLKKYTMVVRQDAQDLVVETQMEGDLKRLEFGRSGGRILNVPQSKSDAILTDRVGSSSSRPFGGGVPPVDNNPTDGAIALQTAIPEATYSLAGKKATAQVMGTGEVTLKANWSKDGKSLALSMAHQETIHGQHLSVTSKERWVLSGDGQALIVQRTVATPQGGDTVNLAFRKMPGSATTPQL